MDQEVLSNAPEKPSGAGRLIVSGTGISLGQISQETLTWLRNADFVLHCVADEATKSFIASESRASYDLYQLYSNKKLRQQTYEEMTSRIVDEVEGGKVVLALFYGHPGIFCCPSHMAISRLREKGYEATMLPAISSLDCLFADLGIDPVFGCSIVEATDLVIKRKAIDTTVPLIVWQAGSFAELGFSLQGFKIDHFNLLVEFLLQSYPPETIVTVYEASPFSVLPPTIENIALKNFSKQHVTGVSTLYIPALTSETIDRAMLERSGMFDIIANQLRNQTAEAGSN